MCKDQFNREVDKSLAKVLSRFLKESEKQRSSNAGSTSYGFYNKFILESFNEPRRRRYSVSQLAKVLRESKIDINDISYLITRYIDGLFLLAQLHNKEQVFCP